LFATWALAVTLIKRQRSSSFLIGGASFNAEQS